MSDELSDVVSELQYDLASVDMLARHLATGRDGRLELLVVKLDRIKIKMYQEVGHRLPHLHVDYGKRHHVASYSIDPARRLAGDLDAVYERTVLRWIEMRGAQLTELWDAVQAGGDGSDIVATLEGDD